MIAEFINLKEAGATAEQAVPRLAAYYHEQNLRVLILAVDQARAQKWDELLWSFEPASFLPHARAEAPQAPDEPVLITTELVNLNKAQVLILADQGREVSPEAFGRVVELIPLEEGPNLEACRERFRNYRNAKQIKLIHTETLPAI